MPRASRRLIALPLLAAALLAGCGTEPDTPATGSSGSSGVPATSAVAPPSPAVSPVQRVELSYAGGEVTGGTQRVSVPLGEMVAITVTGDAADEVHVHGYDEVFNVAPGAEGTATFTADIPGVFEVALHESGLVLAQLEVS